MIFKVLKEVITDTIRTMEQENRYIAIEVIFFCYVQAPSTISSVSHSYYEF